MSGSSWGDRISEAADDLAAGDEVEAVGDSVEEKLDVVASELKRIKELTATELDSAGTAHVPEADDHPFAYSVIPPGKDWRLAVPSGTTTINFEEGTVRNENLNEPVLDDDDVVSIRDMSRNLDETTAKLRSVHVLADSQVHMRLDGGPWHEIDPSCYYPIPSQGFTEVELYAPLPYEFEMKASTRREPFDVSGVSVHSTRYGELSSGVYDSYEWIPMQPGALFADHGDEHGASWIQTIGFDTNTIIVRNTSSKDNNAQCVIQAKQGYQGDWRTIASSDTSIPDGSHDVFELRGAYNWLRVGIRNKFDGEEISADVEYAGVN